MVNLSKIIGRIFGISFEWMLIFILFFSFAIRVSTFQTYLAQIATTYLSSELKTEMRIEKISVVSFNQIAVDGILIKDLKKDTLAYISTAYLTLSRINEKNKFIIKKVEVEKSVFKLRQDKITRDFNYQFIVDYFSTKDTTSSKPIIIQLKELHLKDVDFHYDDYKHKNIPWGMDYDHLLVKHINLDVTDITINQGVIRSNIKQMSAIEKSGFQLNKLSCLAMVSEKGVYCRNVKVKTPHSTIYAPKFRMIMNHYLDYMTFIDSVNFEGYMLPSMVSMTDIAYFSPILQGMNQTVYAKGSVTGKSKNIRIKDLDLTTGDRSRIIGDITLPDFRSIETSYFKEEIKYAYITIKDLKNIQLPLITGLKHIEFNDYLKRLSFFEIENAKFQGGYTHFHLNSDKIKTRLGTIELKNGLNFTENKKNKSLNFQPLIASDFDIKIDSFKIGNLLQNKDFNILNGEFNISGEMKSFTDIQFNTVNATIQSFDYLNYPYKNIQIENGSFTNNILNSQFTIKDENLNLTYDGEIDFNGEVRTQINVDISHSNLQNLHLTESNNSKLKSKFELNLTGNNLNNIAGTILIDSLNYAENKKEFNLPALYIQIKRTNNEDLLSIKSVLGSAIIKGKVDFNNIIYDFENQTSKLFPAIIPLKKLDKNHFLRTKNNFTYSVETNQLNNLLSLLLPELKIAPGTKIEGNYNGKTEEVEMSIYSKSIRYSNLSFEGVSIKQQMKSNILEAKYAFKKLSINDSLQFKNLSLILTGNKDILNTKINWNPSTLNESAIEWNTSVLGIDKFDITLLPSYFSLKEKKWDIINKSIISINGTTLDIGHFLLERNQQYLSIDGRISKNDGDQLNFKINDFKLEEFSSAFGSPVEIKGLVNGWGYLSNPYTNLRYVGDANIQNLFINKNEIGNTFIKTQWDNASKSIGLSGDLIYSGNETFGFNGRYYIDRQFDNLDFNLIFDNADIQFVNAFMDPEVLTNIQGFISGNLKVNGEIDNPKLNGDVQLVKGNARLELLDVNFGLNGKISSDQYGFYINNMPITDEEGNTGSIIGSLYHQKFADWNFDLVFNLEDNGNRNGYAPGLIQPLDRFLIMNTTYNKEDVYFGKGYGTGIVEVSGTSENISIDVNLKTEEGTKVNFPMYGISDIEEEKFITFKSKNNIDTTFKNSKLDFTGIDLKMNFIVTPEAEIKIILDDKTGDEISAIGSGDISVSLDNFNNLRLDGTFKIKEGDYNFVKRPINQKFIIEENSTVAWTGDPYNALLDLKCYYSVNANLNEISTLQTTGTGAGTGSQEIKCFLILTETLLKPSISFDIVAPKTNDAGQSLLNRIKSDNDLLNKQFFSLLLFKKFQPIDGQSSIGGGGGSSAALDLAQSKINEMLSQVSKDYKLNVGLDRNTLTQGTSYSVGVTKGFYDDRLILKGNFGVENTGSSIDNSKSFPIGDVNVEYTLNDAGTFRVSVFNESNQNRIYTTNSANFTQGTGIQYQEEFNSMKDFKLFQYFLDLFRSKKNKTQHYKRSKNKIPTPPIELKSTSFIQPENYWNTRFCF